jgi:hypothetical protein
MKWISRLRAKVEADLARVWVLFLRDKAVGRFPIRLRNPARMLDPPSTGSISMTTTMSLSAFFRLEA